ncbi:hypothetical protein BGW38_007623, partial [Lunasporangiospora selenospora]
PSSLCLATMMFFMSDQSSNPITTIRISFLSRQRSISCGIVQEILCQPSVTLTWFPCIHSRKDSVLSAERMQRSGRTKMHRSH